LFRSFWENGHAAVQQCRVYGGEAGQFAVNNIKVPTADRQLQT